MKKLYISWIANKNRARSAVLNLNLFILLQPCRDTPRGKWHQNVKKLKSKTNNNNNKKHHMTHHYDYDYDYNFSY